MRVRFVKKTTQADHLKAFQHGGSLQIAHMHYGAGLGDQLAMYAFKHLVVPAGKGAVKGALHGLISDHSGTYADKMKRGALKGAVGGIIKGGGKKTKKRPF